MPSFPPHRHSLSNAGSEMPRACKKRVYQNDIPSFLLSSMCKSFVGKLAFSVYSGEYFLLFFIGHRFHLRGARKYGIRDLYTS